MKKKARSIFSVADSSRVSVARVRKAAAVSAAVRAIGSSRARTATPKDGAIARKLVWFDIKGPRDTMLAFNSWLIEMRRIPRVGGSTGPVGLGPGRVDPSRHSFSGGFQASDADAVTEWLEVHGIPVTRP